MRRFGLLCWLAARCATARQQLLPHRIVQNIALQPLRFTARVRGHGRVEGLVVLDADGSCELLVEGARRRPVAASRAGRRAPRAPPPTLSPLGFAIVGSWTMLPAGHEILDRLWDTIRLEAAVGDEVFECTAKLYARHPHRRALTSHGTVLGGGRRFFRPVVASFSLAPFEPPD